MKEKVNKNYPIIIGVNKDLDKNYEKYQNSEFIKKKIARVKEILSKSELPERK